MKKVFFRTFVLGLFLGLYAQPFLEPPIEGTQGNEWIIVNYVDWGVMEFGDYNCGTKSYDGHQGTDFVLQSFQAMDDSVAVYAAAAGMVTYTIDSLYDRETEGDVSKQLGNYIALSHSNGFYTYYGHLMQHSIQVEVGESVDAGDLIGYVGSSGNSTDPHLHFELWYDSLYVVDPFAGPCGNATDRFIDPPAYDTSLTVWESGLHLKNDLKINELRERIVTIEEPYTIETTSDSSLYFWAHLYGLRKGKELSIKWYTHSNVEWFTYSFILDSDHWYYYYWSFLDHQNLAIGDWSVKLFYDGTEIALETFKVIPVVLPIELVSFKAEKRERKITLNWSTTSESSNAKFEIEHSTSGNEFVKIGEIKGSGTTVEAIHYSYNHDRPAYGQNYYRLKQIDFDGQFEYSQIVSVELGREGLNIGKLFPNPSSNGEIYLSYLASRDSKAAVTLYDLAGNYIFSAKKTFLKEAQFLNLNFTILQKGVYLVEITNEFESEWRKLIIH